MMKINLDKVSAYTPMSVQHLQDEDLSLAAKGMLSLMQTIPDRRERFDIRSLILYSSDPVSVAVEAYNELIEANYLIDGEE